MKFLVSALRILTALPVPGKECPKTEDALYAFPFVGALLGLLLWLTAQAPLPALVAAALLLTVQTLITRGFHLDGMADTADGFGGGFTRERTLEIMKDSRIGAFGAMALILTLLLKFSLFHALLSAGQPAALYAAMLISRTAQVFLCFTLPSARPSGMAAATVQNARPQHLTVALLCAILLAIPAGLRFLPLMAVGLGVAFFWGRYCLRRVGGITGDLLGAANELVEISVLTGALLLC